MNSDWFYLDYPCAMNRLRLALSDSAEASGTSKPLQGMVITLRICSVCLRSEPISTLLASQVCLEGGIELFHEVEHGKMAYIGSVADDTKDVLGREPLLLRDWAKLHADELLEIAGS